MKKSKEKPTVTSLNVLSKLLLLMIMAGAIGFVYEVIFYRINDGMWIKRGITFGPWIPIYSFGALGMYFANKKIKKNPIIIFLICAFVSFVLEYGIGYFLLKVFNTRLWDYNIEMWNFGNIDGFVCARSILLFAFAGLFLVYVLIPFLDKIYNKKNNKFTVYTGLVLGSIYIIDIIVSIFIKFF